MDDFRQEIIDAEGADIMPYAKNSDGKYTVYLDTEGYPTQGHGRLLEHKKYKKSDLPILQKRYPPVDNKVADKWLTQDINKARSDAGKFVKNFSSLDKDRQDVLTNMIFNLGLTNLNKFSELKKAIEKEDWEKASYEMMHNSKSGPSEWATQVKGRASELSNRMRNSGDNMPKDNKQKNKDVFASMNSDDYFDNAEKSKKALQQDYEQYLAKCMKLMHHPEMRDKVMQVAGQGEPIDSAANAVTGLMAKVDTMLRKGQDRVPDEIKAAVAVQLINQLGELGEASGQFSLPPEKQKAAIAAATQKYLDTEIQSGRIDPQALSEEAGRSVHGMTPEQRQEVDTQMKDIDTIAQQSKAEYEQGLQSGLAAKSFMGGTL